MHQASSSRQKLAHVAQSLLIGAVGGFLFNAAKFPAGWLAGSMVFAAVAALAGRPIQVPRQFARVCSVVLGIAIGGGVAPQTLHGMMTWPLSIAMVAGFLAAATRSTLPSLPPVRGC